MKFIWFKQILLPNSRAKIVLLSVSFLLFFVLLGIVVKGLSTSIIETPNRGQVGGASTKLSSSRKSPLLRFLAYFSPSLSTGKNNFCLQVITYGKNKETGECKEFPNSCLPDNYEKVDSCRGQSVPTLPPSDKSPTPTSTSTPAVGGPQICLPVFTYGRNKNTGECKEFPNSCLPDNYVETDDCQRSSSLSPEIIIPTPTLRPTPTVERPTPTSSSPPPTRSLLPTRRLPSPPPFPTPHDELKAPRFFQLPVVKPVVDYFRSLWVRVFSLRPRESSPCNCITLYDPVCGEDRKTYSNECTAACVEKKVLYRGGCTSSGEYFTFQEVDETFKIFVSNNRTIEDAIENYFGRNNKHIPIGPVVDDRPGKSPYDRQWSWHLDEKETTMAENSIEVCQGLPSFVENNLDYWLKTVKVYCPAGAEIISVGPKSP